ncbi:MAG: hypothetical protein IMZ61_07250 [Planctomycetes bacterium]|nr:hypothetical protein [Planctomycetota bacterium]
MPHERKNEAKVYMTISGDLISQVARWFYEGLRSLAGGNVTVLREERNGYAPSAMPSYIVAVAAVEAFINEAFLSPIARLHFEGSSLYQLNCDWLERVDIREKIIITARLLLGATLKRDKQPFQDFRMLVAVRNEIIHYKMDATWPSFVRDLNQRKIGLDRKPPKGSDAIVMCAQPWASEISTTEGIRWAHNTAIGMMQHMIEIMPGDGEEFRKRGLDGEMKYERFRFVSSSVAHYLSNMKLIDEKARDRAWEELGIGRQEAKW